MARQLTEADVLAFAMVAGGGGGTGEGDMKKSLYDPDDNVSDAGGIEAYFSTALSTALSIDNDGYINL